MSDDGRHAITLIAFLGSVFSPFYFRDRDRPYDHCAMNVALYGSGLGKWAFTEYPHGSVSCRADSLTLGANQVTWNGRVLSCRIDETAAPIPVPLRGTVHLYPETLSDSTLPLDDESRHCWRPIMPRARIVVLMERPFLRWSGAAYLDSNSGAEPLHAGMRSWTWLRAHSNSGTTVIYDVTPLRGLPKTHALTIGPSGQVDTFEAPPPVKLRKTGWRIDRRTSCDVGFEPSILQTLEDAPFYARSLLETRIRGEQLRAVHESLSLERFRAAWVRALLPFRMRRSRR